CALTAGRDSRSSCIRASAAGHRPYDQKGFPPRRDRVREGSVRRLVGEILLARKEPYQWTPLLRGGITDRPAQHWILCLQRVEDRALRRRALNLERHLSADARQRPKMLRKHDVDHGSVCTSTDKTGGRSRTAAVHLSPALADTDTWPPVVPKWTPHGSSESIAVPSRNTLTYQSRCGRQFGRASDSSPPVRLRYTRSLPSGRS